MAMMIDSFVIIDLGKHYVMLGSRGGMLDSTVEDASVYSDLKFLKRFLA